MCVCVCSAGTYCLSNPGTIQTEHDEEVRKAIRSFSALSKVLNSLNYGSAATVLTSHYWLSGPGEDWGREERPLHTAPASQPPTAPERWRDGETRGSGENIERIWREYGEMEESAFLWSSLCVAPAPGPRPQRAMEGNVGQGKPSIRWR